MSSEQPESMKRVEGFEQAYSDLKGLETAIDRIASVAHRSGLRVSIQPSGKPCASDPLGQRGLVICTWSY